MKQVQLRGQDEPVTLEEVTVDNDEAIAGITRSGKKFVTLRNRLRDSLPIRHPYRVYLRNGAGLRVIAPSFEDAEEWFLHGEEKMDFTLPDGMELEITRDEVLSLLSATPEDAANAIAASN